MKAKEIKKQTKSLKDVLEKIHSMDDDDNVPVADLRKFDKSLDKSVSYIGKHSC